MSMKIRFNSSPTGSRFSTSSGYAIFVHPTREPQTFEQVSALEHATRSLNKILAAIPGNTTKYRGKSLNAAARRHPAFAWVKDFAATTR